MLFKQRAYLIVHEKANKLMTRIDRSTNPNMHTQEEVLEITAALLAKAHVCKINLSEINTPASDCM